MPRIEMYEPFRETQTTAQQGADSEVVLGFNALVNHRELQRE